MLPPTAKSNMARSQTIRDAILPRAALPAPYDHRRNQPTKRLNSPSTSPTPHSSTPHSSTSHSPSTPPDIHPQTIGRPTQANSANSQKGGVSGADSRRSLPKNSFLKRLDILYWKRLLRYLYVRFLRMRSSPKAIARGAAAGAFAGAFPLLGLQSIVGVAIASCVRGSKVVAVASTWVSNPLTYVPLFALNFHIGRTLLRLPPAEIPNSAVGIDVWMAMGMDVGAALMLGSLITGLILSAIAYYVGIRVAKRVQSRRHR